MAGDRQSQYRSGEDNLISREQLRDISRRTGLSLYQQEKDYFQKLFLHGYFNRYEDAVFKGGTCLAYLFGLDRFSEDLDFNLLASPETFEDQVDRTVDDLKLIGAEAYFIRKELFEESFTCEIGLHGPLYMGSSQTRNMIRIDDGKRTGTLEDPEWKLISSEYPETRERFLVLVMNEEEMLVEKAIALMERAKGRDLYDLWFMLEKGVPVNEDLYLRKGGQEFKPSMLVSKEDYERDLERLSRRIIPYSQVSRDVERSLSALKH